ncbi:MAG: Stf0 family sulfotransferase [Pseudomonadota bacterium]
MAYAAYVLCTAPRSGSTLLCNLLRDTGVAGHPGSHFHRPSLADWRRSHDLPDTATLPQIIAAATKTGRGNTPIFGLRLQRHSAPFFFDQLATQHPEASSDMARLTATFGPTALIYLHRADKLAQAVSLVRAAQSGLWHRNADGSELERTAPPQAPRYDRAAIAKAVADVTAYDAGWEDWFAQERVTPLRLDYSALSDDPVAVLSQTLDHLGLDARAAQSITPAVAKLSDATNAAWITRFGSEGT